MLDARQAARLKGRGTAPGRSCSRMDLAEPVAEESVEPNMYCRTNLCRAVTEPSSEAPPFVVARG
jgi:hypothetical protein